MTQTRFNQCVSGLIMYAMPQGDDLDARFNELVSQIDGSEQRRMRAAATKGVRSPREPKRPRGPRRSRRGLLAAAAVFAVLSAAGLVLTFRPDLLGPSSGVRQALALETQPVVDAPNPEDPFSGSPAEDYADGMAGFVTPTAKAMGGLSRKEVAAGIDRTGKLFEAAYLNRESLLGGKTTAFINLLDPEDRSGYRRRPHDWVLSFAPNTAEFAADNVKVHGKTTLSPAGKHVSVNLDYLVVYAVRRPGQPQSTIRLVTHLHGSVSLTPGGGLAIEKWAQDSTPARCDVQDGFVHPVYPDSPADKVPPSGALQDPYELSQQGVDDCGASEGT